MKPKFRAVSPPAGRVTLVVAAGLATGARGGDDSPVQKMMVPDPLAEMRPIASGEPDRPEKDGR